MMRKLLAAAVCSVLAMSYVADPSAVGGAVGSTVGLGATIFHALVGGVGASTTTDPAGGGHIETLPDGTRVWVPAGATLDTTPKG